MDGLSALADYAIPVAVLSGGDNPLGEPPSRPFAALCTRFTGGLCCVARAVCSRRGRRSGVVGAVCRARVKRSAALRYL